MSASTASRPVPASASGGKPPLARDLNAVVADGVFFSVMVGLGEAYIPAFTLAVGLGEVVAALVATLPMLAGALFQLVTPWAVRRLRSYRRWIVLCASLQAVSFLPLVAGALRGQISLAWLAVGTVSYWSFGMATSPAWNAWVTSLVPTRIRIRFFAGRVRSAQTALLVALMSGGLLLQWGREQQAELTWFALLFATAILARLTSARFLARQSEAPALAEAHRTLMPPAILRAVRQAGSARVLVYLLGTQAVVNVAAPFFTPYMLKGIALSYYEYMLLTAGALLARIAVLPLVGRVARRWGTRVVLWWGAFGIVPLPVLWMVSDDLLYLFLLQLVSGAAWAALEFASLLSFFEGIEERDRTSVLSAFNFANAAAIALGALVGSRLFVAFDGAVVGYGWLFAVSTAGRLVMLLVLRGTVPARRILRLRLRTLAVRPAMGAVDRPILASLSAEPAPPPQSAATAGSSPPSSPAAR